MKIKVLVVDDNEVSVSLVKKYFNGSSDICIYKCASNGKEAIDIINEGEIDLILLDLIMPIKDGFFVLDSIKEKNISIPVIVTTSYNEDETIRRVSEYGVKYYALKPYGRTALNALKDADYDVISIGKINDIFDGEGITRALKSKSSVHGMEQTVEVAKEEFNGLCFVNLVDFDALWGHRRDPIGYAKEIEAFDEKLGVLLETLREDDLLIITADHGNDPTYTGTDHTREKVPFLAYAKCMEHGGELPEQDTFAVIGATVAENFGVAMPKGTIGHSILGQLQ